MCSMDSAGTQARTWCSSGALLRRLVMSFRRTLTCMWNVSSARFHKQSQPLSLTALFTTRLLSIACDFAARRLPHCKSSARDVWCTSSVIRQVGYHPPAFPPKQHVYWTESQSATVILAARECSLCCLVNKAQRCFAWQTKRQLFQARPEPTETLQCCNALFSLLLSVWTL